MWSETSLFLSRELVPKPQDGDRSYDAENKILKVSGSGEIDVEKRADERPDIASHNSDKEIHATSLALTAHDAVGNVADDYASEYRPCGEL